MPARCVSVTGAAGQIAYALVFRLAAGELFGTNQPIRLRLIDLPDMLPAVEAVRMEIEDANCPLVEEILVTSDLSIGFQESTLFFLIGSKPRNAGMERRDLLRQNGPIFVTQGKALEQWASQEARVIVVGNPCNTNCLIAASHAPRLPKENFISLMRLDENRARSLLARKAGVPLSSVSPVAIFGNHSSTMVPDFLHATIDHRPVIEVIPDRRWLEEEFFSLVQQRGAAILQKRGKSSAASAAAAALQTAKHLFFPSKEEFSAGIFSLGNPYGIDQNLIFSFPCKWQEGQRQIIRDLELDPFLSTKIRLSERELQEERACVEDFLHAQL